MTKTLYFDESGWTGFDFLNADQPVFVVSSSDIPEETAAEILRASFPRYQGAEFKFSNIWRSPRNRPGFIDFADAVGQHEGHIFSWVTIKRFAIVTKIVDF